MILIHDSFTDTDGTLLRNHVADTGGQWTSPYFNATGFTDRDYEVRSGTARTKTWVTADPSVHYNQSSLATLDYDVELGFAVSGLTTDVEMIAYGRAGLSSISGGVYARVTQGGTSGTAKLYRQGILFASATLSGLAPVVGTHTLKLSMTGDACSVYYDGNLVLSGNQPSPTTGAYSGLGIGTDLADWPSDIKVDYFTVSNQTVPAFWTNFFGQREVA